ncbi:GNAT family N-acetyltransferase [Krasilnikoviella flava]|uniref:Acetyltransferase (GNAT) family protein n=1 Tax=Krasilnikoviella flava TaxID=526729 RepID=A0A1T5L9V8_9MICO|nr:GNAT family N-acetyltransferase [Krasilnikoviella flava]SKC72704.1 Acetyltransferase (GNAT) family protein [Krasilnikoviella flava]
MATPTSTALAPLAERVAAPSALPALAAGGLTWRPAARDDAPVLLGLRNTIAEADHEPYRESLGELVEILEAPWRRLEHDSVLGFDTDGSLAAYGYVETMPGDVSRVRAFLWGGVRPDRRGEGIGRELHAWLVARGRQVLGESGKALPGRLAAFVEDDLPPARLRLFERAGFTAQRFYSDLERDLRDLDAHPLPDVGLDPALRLLPLRAEHDEPARLAHNDAFRDHWGSEPQTPEQWTSGRSTYAPEWSFVVVDPAPDVDALLTDPATDAETAAALRAGAPLVVGYHVAARYTEDFAVRGYPFGYTDILGVRRAYRGRRVAPALLAAGMRAFAADGMAAAALDVDTQNPSGAHGLYASLGYTKRHGSRLLTIEF